MEKIVSLCKRRGFVFPSGEIYVGLNDPRVDDILFAAPGEAGTPFCITVDGDTATTDTVTVRERDSCAQTRVAVNELGRYLAEQIGG